MFDKTTETVRPKRGTPEYTPYLQTQSVDDLCKYVAKIAAASVALAMMLKLSPEDTLDLTTEAVAEQVKDYLTAHGVSI